MELKAALPPRRSLEMRHSSVAVTVALMVPRSGHSIMVQGVFFCSVWRPRWRPPTPPIAFTRTTQHTSDPKEGALQARSDRGGDAHLAAALQPAASTAAAARCTAGTRRATTAARTSGVERAARGREVHGRPARHSSGSRSIASSKDTPAPQVHVAQNARPRRVEKYSRTSWGSTTVANRKSPTATPRAPSRHVA